MNEFERPLSYLLQKVDWLCIYIVLQPFHDKYMTNLVNNYAKKVNRMTYLSSTSYFFLSFWQKEFGQVIYELSQIR